MRTLKRLLVLTLLTVFSITCHAESFSGNSISEQKTIAANNVNKENISPPSNLLIRVIPLEARTSTTAGYFWVSRPFKTTATEKIAPSFNINNNAMQSTKINSKLYRCSFKSENNDHSETTTYDMDKISMQNAAESSGGYIITITRPSTESMNLNNIENCWLKKYQGLNEKNDIVIAFGYQMNTYEHTHKNVLFSKGYISLPWNLQYVAPYQTIDPQLHKKSTASNLKLRTDQPSTCFSFIFKENDNLLPHPLPEEVTYIFQRGIYSDKICGPHDLSRIEHDIFEGGFYFFLDDTINKPVYRSGIFSYLNLAYFIGENVKIDETTGIPYCHQDNKDSSCLFASGYYLFEDMPCQIVRNPSYPP